MDSRGRMGPQVGPLLHVVPRPRAHSLLVIDDDPVHRMVIGKVGQKAGYRLTTSGSVEEAMAKLAEQKFDCISLDLSLGGQSGQLLLDSIAQNNKDALLIIISGAAPELREATLASARGQNLNVIDAPKPVDLVSLRRSLDEGIAAAG